MTFILKEVYVLSDLRIYNDVYKIAFLLEDSM